MPSSGRAARASSQAGSATRPSRPPLAARSSGGASSGTPRASARGSSRGARRGRYSYGSRRGVGQRGSSKAASSASHRSVANRAQSATRSSSYPFPVNTPTSQSSSPSVSTLPPYRASSSSVGTSRSTPSSDQLRRLQGSATSPPCHGIPSHSASVKDPDDELDDVNEIIMALDMQNNGAVGCVYYVGVEETMYFQEDVPMAGMEFVETLLLHGEPTTILVPSRAPERMIEYLEKNALNFDENRTASSVLGAFALHTVASADFNRDAAIERLANLDLPGIGPQRVLLTSAVEEEMGDGFQEGDTTRQSRLLKLSTCVNFDSRISVGCAGALLAYIQRRKSVEFMANDPQADFAFRIRDVKLFAALDSLFINLDTMLALQIIQQESHPNAQRSTGKESNGGGSKESLSVYGLFHFLASTPQGKAKLRQVFVRPSRDIELIQERHRAISIFLRPENSVILDDIVRCLRRIRNIRTTCTRLQRGISLSPGAKSMKTGVWSSLHRFAAYTIELMETVTGMSGAESLDVLNKMNTEIQPRALKRVGQLISRTIDFEDSEVSGRTTVARGVSETLDNLKHTYDGLHYLLDEVAKRQREQVPAWARHYVTNCIFYPQIGFLTVVTIDAHTRGPAFSGEGMAGEQPWEQMFATEDAVYCKNQRMRELDAEIGDLFIKITDEEIEIVHALGVKILEHEQTLIATSDLCGDLDVLVALALGARKYNFVKPTLSLENIIDIKGGRHPLQELVVPSFIPNDCYLQGGPGPRSKGADEESMETDIDAPSTLLMTGPNHSGKSVYLKQVAIIVYMAHLGSFVPAAQADIGLTDRILTRIATRESVSRNESAFAIDLHQAAFTMKFATRQSLLLIDEFGKGTNPLDGAALFASLILHFLDLGPDRPKVLAATHFHELHDNRHFAACPHLEYGHMEVYVDEGARDYDEQTTFLYQVRSGWSLSSFGILCAALNGVNDAVLERAEAFAHIIARNEDLEEACEKLSDGEMARLERAETVARAFLEWDVDKSKRRGGGNHEDDDQRLRERLADILGVGESSQSLEEDGPGTQ